MGVYLQFGSKSSQFCHINKNVSIRKQYKKVDSFLVREVYRLHLDYLLDVRIAALFDGCSMEQQLHHGNCYVNNEY